MSIYSIFNLNNLLNFNFKFFNYKKISYIAIFFLIVSNIFLVRVNSYISFYTNLSTPINEEFIAKISKAYSNTKSFGYKSTNFYCYASEETKNSVQNITKNLINTYTFYIPLNTHLYK